MRIAQDALFVLFCIGLLCASALTASASDIRVNSLKDALIRWLCWEDYWVGETFSPGKEVSVKIKSDADRFHVLGRGELATGAGYAFSYSWGRIKNDAAAVIMSETYSTGIDGKGLEGTLFEDRRRIFETGEILNDQFIMPLDCTPRFDPPSPKKELMVRTIVNTIKTALVPSNELEKETFHYPPEVTLTIADFNIDYPYTEVLVEPVGEIYGIALHDLNNYDSDEYERSGEYPWNPLPNTSQDNIAKIRKHGMIMKIILSP